MNNRQKYLSWLIVTAFSVFYFIDVFSRASIKYFWFDELLTLYLSRIPSLHSLWLILLTAVDSNPPGFHLLTRATESIFGEGLVATRLPEILAFWILCLCLFYLVKRRAGLLSASIALTLPMLTGAYYYAYEARPLIIIVALAALAWVAWDRAWESPVQRTEWLIAFSLTLFTSYMLHCYAVLLVIPFALAELFHYLHTRQVRRSVWLYLLVPLLPTMALYLPLARAFRAISRGTDFLHSFPPNWPSALQFYSTLVGPCIEVLLLGIVLLAINGRIEAGEPNSSIGLTSEDVVLSAGFAALPVIGMLLGNVVHSPYFGRYFLSALVGIVIPFAVLTGARSRAGINWRGAAVQAVIIAGLGYNFARLVVHRVEGTGPILVEPSTGIRIADTPGQPLEVYPFLSSVRAENLPVAVLTPWDFFYLAEYAPDLRRRLYLVHSSDTDATIRTLAAFKPFSPVDYNLPLLMRDFAASTPDFYVQSNPAKSEEFARLSSLAGVEKLRADGANLFARMRTESK